MKIEHLVDAQALARQYMQECGEAQAQPICTRETPTLFGLESRRFICIISKGTGRVLWLRPRHRQS